MKTGFPEVDDIIAYDAITEFFSLDYNLLFSFYHKVIVESAPIDLLLVGERGGLNPYSLTQLARVLGISNIDDKIFVRRAFKVEDVPASISSFKGELIIVDPYHHGKFIDEIAASIKERGSRTLIFSFGNRLNYKSTFGWHVASSILELKETKGGFKVRLIKSPAFPEFELKYPVGALYCDEKTGLGPWLTLGL